MITTIIEILELPNFDQLINSLPFTFWSYRAKMVDGCY